MLDVFPTRHPLQSIQNSSKSTIFLILISAPICTRSFPRGFSLATPNYVLCRRLPSLLQNFVCSLYRIFCTSLSISLYLHKASSCVLLAKLCCDLGHDPQTATFPRMPSITDLPSTVNMGLLLEAGCIVLENWWLRWDSNPPRTLFRYFTMSDQNSCRKINVQFIQDFLH